MKTIRIPTFSECFFREPRNTSELWKDGFITVLLRGCGHPRVAHSFLVLMLVLFLPFQQIALGLIIFLIAGRFLLRWQIRHVSEKVNLKLRIDSTKIQEGQSLSLFVQIANTSWWRLYRTKLFFQFPPGRKSLLEMTITPSISPKEIRTQSLQGLCDRGMGRYRLGPATFIISDLFNLYHATIEIDFEEMITVQPRMETMPPIPTANANASDLFGLYEIPIRGVDVNFYGLRPFSAGDSIRHIAWRPTAKLGSLVVKEFERLVPSDVSLFVNLDPNLQVGTSELSTWVTLKRLALNLATQILQEGHSLRFADNRGFIERGFGSEQLLRITQSLVVFDIEEEIHLSELTIELQAQLEEKDNSIIAPLPTWYSRIPPGSTLFYATVLSYNHLVYSIATFKKILLQQVEIKVFLVNPLNFWKDKGLNFNIDLSPESKLAQLMKDIQQLGITIYLLNMGDSVAKGLTPWHLNHSGSKGSQFGAVKV